MWSPPRLTRRAVLAVVTGVSLTPALASCAFQDSGFQPGIYLVPLGGEPRLIVADPARPVPSPDGAAIAWASERGVWTTAIGGDANHVRIAPTAAAAVPAWAPDGSLLAWIDRASREIAVADLVRGSSATFPLLVPEADGGLVAIALRNQPSWAPDGSAFAFLAWDGNGDEVYRIAPDGSQRRQLSNIRSSSAPVGGENANGQTKAVGDALRPAWSPTADRVAFAVAPETAGATGGVFVVNADVARQRRLSPRLSGFGPLWSPNGARLLIVLHGDEGPDLCLLDVAMRELVNLTAGTGLVPLDAAWSPDGGRIAFSANGAIHGLDLGSGEFSTIADTPLDDRAPAWTSDGQSVLFMASVDLFDLPAMPDIP